MANLQQRLARKFSLAAAMAIVLALIAGALFFPRPAPIIAASPNQPLPELAASAVLGSSGGEPASVALEPVPDQIEVGETRYYTVRANVDNPTVNVVSATGSLAISTSLCTPTIDQRRGLVDGFELGLKGCAAGTAEVRMRQGTQILLIYQVTVTESRAAAQANYTEPPGQPPAKEATRFPLLDVRLRAAYQNATADPSRRTDAPAPGLLRDAQQRIALTIHFHNADAVPAAQSLLEQGGAVIGGVGTDYIVAQVPPSLLGSIANLKDLKRAIPVEERVDLLGDVLSAGVAAHGADHWHEAGFTGAGVKVGVIDGGFMGLGYQINERGNLKGPVHVRCWQTYDFTGDYSTNIGDCQVRSHHGTGVAEILMDTAPDTILYLANPHIGHQEHAVVEWMVSEGVQVINFSQGRTMDGPGDGTSPYSDSILRAIDKAVAGGSFWSGGAGNDAGDATGKPYWYSDNYDVVEVAYEDGSTARWVDFEPGDAVNYAMGINVDRCVYIRWEGQWFGSPNTLTDLDFYHNNGASVLSADDQSVTNLPYETICPSGSGGASYGMNIRITNGPAPKWIQLYSKSGWGGPSYATKRGSITAAAESANPGMLAVGAANYATTTVIEDYSSQGPAPDGRIKPDIVGASGAASSSYITPTNAEGTWRGTSQSAPHIAGLAALITQRAPLYSPADVADYLKKTALERGDAGPDDVWGHGFALLPDVAIPMPPAPPQLTGGDGQLHATWNDPTDDASGVAADYDLRYRRTTADAWTYLNDDTGAEAANTSLNATIAGLDNGDAYQVQARSETADHASVWSNIATGYPGFLPGPVVAGHPSPGDGSVTLRWQGPDAAGTHPISGYRISYQPGNQTIDVPDPDAVAYTVTGLTNGVEYQFTVAALSLVGAGPASQTITAIAGTPDRPDLVIKLDDGQITALWSTPASHGWPIIDYDLRYRADGDTWTSADGATALTANQLTVSGLTNGTTYQWQARAENANGEGPWSATILAAPAAAAYFMDNTAAADQGSRGMVSTGANGYPGALAVMFRTGSTAIIDGQTRAVAGYQLDAVKLPIAREIFLTPDQYAVTINEADNTYVNRDQVTPRSPGAVVATLASDDNGVGMYTFLTTGAAPAVLKPNTDYFLTFDTSPADSPVAVWWGGAAAASLPETSDWNWMRFSRESSQSDCDQEFVCRGPGTPAYGLVEKPANSWEWIATGLDVGDSRNPPPMKFAILATPAFAAN